eukprot:gnl/Chilomastix_caulleri/1501.p1 GENE.gnl/Chilomastix_caulleri/1501~~gnl/Chilomastix_caulleri/1501.p1  ORF type:complete len:128 (+),score=17.05 gnl/Chilomastix_caulleri/1501:16-399(+)
MCKHILNTQVAIYAPCCRKWFECAECHNETETHPILRRTEMVFACKKCKKTFRVDLTDFDPESDGFCPKCDNKWYVEAEVPADEVQKELKLENLDEKDAFDLIADERDPDKEKRRKEALQRKPLGRV